MSNFNALLESEIPKLKRYARALCRNPADADDLLQDSLLLGMRKSHLWQDGTNLRAWLSTIMHNQHVNVVRRAVREGIKVSIDDVAPKLACPASQEDALQLRDIE